MTFRYKTLDQKGSPSEGTIDAINIEVAISALQKRGLSIVSIKPEERGFFFKITAFLNEYQTKMWSFFRGRWRHFLVRKFPLLEFFSFCQCNRRTGF